MARPNKSMRQIKEILRLKFEHQLSIREIARSCAVPASTVGDYLKRAELAGLSWPLPEEWTEEQILERLLGVPDPSPEVPLALPDWAHLHEELRRPSVTLRLLWQEYRQTHPDGYGYSRFCELYERWAGTLDPVLRQVHLPGEKMFVDWAGQTIPIYTSTDGTVASASLFVAVLGASNKTFVEAFPNQKLASWISAHAHAYAFFGGVSKITVPDNAKTAVIKACRYEPLLHASYQEMAQHYGTVIIPARPRRPKDKSKVEAAVLIAQRQILAALRDQKFFHLEALNSALRAKVVELNAQPFQKLSGSRDSWFQAQEKSALLPLPSQPYVLALWEKAKVNIDYHAAVAKHYYSAPHGFIHQELDVRLTETTVELFDQGKRVAAHVRSFAPGQFTTLEEHRPKSHQKYLQWTPSRMIHWAGQIGPACAQLVEHILKSRPHPEMGFRSVLGIMRLGKGVGEARLEAACRRALHFGACSYRSIQSILDHQLDQQPLEPELPLQSPNHDNVRGKDYYHPQPQENK
jgi:transposase